MKRLFGIFGIFIFSGLLSFANAARAEEGNEKFMTRLDAIEKKEDDILKELAELKAELQIVKIRASLRA